MTTRTDAANGTLPRRKPSAATGKTGEIDREAGRRIREARETLGLTQIQLAELIGVTYQQVHKYEKGMNRISLGCVDRICRQLGMTPNDLVPGWGADDATAVRERSDKLLMRLSRAARAVPDRQLVIAFTQALEAVSGTGGE